MLREAALRATAELGSRGRQRRSKMISSSSSLRPGKPGSIVVVLAPTRSAGFGSHTCRVWQLTISQAPCVWETLTGSR